MTKNIANRTMFIHDNLPVLENINKESVDLIYLDPPFNSNKTYSAPIGSKAAGAAFKDAWTLDDIDLAWMGQIDEVQPELSGLIKSISARGGGAKNKRQGDKSYLIFIARRLLEMKRILKPNGSIYLHCDPTMSHSLKLVMDSIFGVDNFRNEIAWCYTGPQTSGNYFPRKHDIILFYARGKGNVFHKDAIRIPSKWNQLGGFNSGTGGKNKGKVPEDWWHMTFGPNSKERTGYPTQKPIALLERFIQASSSKGDVVLDPFCGCATTLVAAEKLEREWIGIDISKKAVDLIRQRLEAEELLWRRVGKGKHLVLRHDIPSRSDKNDMIVNPKEYKHTLYGMQEGNCNGCKVHFPFRNMTIDHIQPTSRGGQNTNDNLQLLCGACNSVKGARLTQTELIAELIRRGVISAKT